jgi:hypothetical protein
VPAPSAARVGFALLTTLPWRPVRGDLDELPPMTQDAPAQELEDFEDHAVLDSWGEKDEYSDKEQQVEPPDGLTRAPCRTLTAEERESILAEIQQLCRLESEWDFSGDGETLVAMTSDALAALPIRFPNP